MTEITQKEMNAFVAGLYSLKKISDGLYNFGQRLAIENRSLKVKIGELKSERDDLQGYIDDLKIEEGGN